jgi:plasmid maintenance system antidote protein VapI
VLGVSPEYARQIIGGHRPLAARHALRLAEFLEAGLAEHQELIRLLREHARVSREKAERKRTEALARAHQASRERRLQRLRAG